MGKPSASLAEMLESSRLYRWRRVMRLVPAAPRCKLCSTPFRGPGRVFRLFGLGPSRKNPSMCTGCFERAPVGGAVGDVGVLFADVRGFTAFAERTPPAEVADLLNRFYAVAREVLLRHDAVIDKLVGDEVMRSSSRRSSADGTSRRWLRPQSSSWRASASPLETSRG